MRDIRPRAIHRARRRRWPPGHAPGPRHRWRYCPATLEVETEVETRPLPHGWDLKPPSTRTHLIRLACRGLPRRAPPSLDAPNPSATNQTHCRQGFASTSKQLGTWDASDPWAGIINTMYCWARFSFSTSNVTFWCFGGFRTSRPSTCPVPRVCGWPDEPTLQNQHSRPQRASCCWVHTVPGGTTTWLRRKYHRRWNWFPEHGAPVHFLRNTAPRVLR